MRTCRLVLAVIAIVLFSASTALASSSPVKLPAKSTTWGKVNSKGVFIKGRPINTEQVRNSQIIISSGKSRGFNRRDVKIALMVAVQESSILNLDHGDRDSVGIFQQRSTWGTIGQRTDPAFSTNLFYDRMATIHNRDEISYLELALQIQRPSRSAYLSRRNYFPGWESSAEQLLGNKAFPPTNHITDPSQVDPYLGFYKLGESLKKQKVKLDGLVKAAVSLLHTLINVAIVIAVFYLLFIAGRKRRKRRRRNLRNSRR